MEMNLVEMWLRKDKTRWVAGAIAGFFAGAIALAFAMVLSKVLGSESWFPAKLVALPVLSSTATEFGMLPSRILAGVIVWEALCTVLGVIFAHFTFTNSLQALLAMGLVWGVFSWIFIWNLFMQSNGAIFAAHVPSAPVFPVCLVFGFGLSSVAFFDRLLRGGAQH